MSLFFRARPAPARTFDEKVRLVAVAMGHRPSGLADIFGGYLCNCERASWVQLAEFGPSGGCIEGWTDARKAVAALEAKESP